MNVSSHNWSPFDANDCVLSRIAMNSKRRIWKKENNNLRGVVFTDYMLITSPRSLETIQLFPWSLQIPLHDTSALLYCFSLTRALVIWPHAYMPCLPWPSYKALKSNLKLRYLMWCTWTVSNNYCLVGLQSFLKCHHTVKLMREVMCGH